MDDESPLATPKARMGSMRRIKPAPPTTTGSGLLKYPGFIGHIDYEIVGTVDDVRARSVVKASIITTAEVAAEAFRQMRGYLQLPCGREFRLNMVAHTAGSGTAYVELTL